MLLMWIKIIVGQILKTSIRDYYGFLMETFIISYTLLSLKDSYLLRKIQMHEINQNQNVVFYVNLLGQLPGLIVVMDKDSKFLYSNKYTAKMFGYLKEEEMIGIDAYGMRCPAVESASDFIQQDKMVIESGQVLTMLDIHQYANGENKILITKKSPYFVNGNIEGSICHCTEIHSVLLTKISAALIQSDKKYYAQNNGNNRSYMLGQMPNKQLTEREMECVFYLMRGNTMKKIARYMNISPRTVETASRLN